MRVFLFLTILILLVSQNLTAQIKSEKSSVEVVSSKWSKSRQKIENNADNNQPITPAQSALNPRVRNIERNRRSMETLGSPELPDQTIEERSAAIDKNEQESRSPKSKFVDGFSYQTKLRNDGKSAVEILFWEYQFKERANPSNVATHQFLCGVNIKPEKEKELLAFSTLSPGKIINADSQAEKDGNPFEEKILINRVEYADGTIWQRKDWNFSEVKPAIERALKTPWGSEMCRSLQ